MSTDLKSQLALLKTLQDIDVILHHIEKELSEIPIKIEAAAAEYKKANDAVLAKKADRADVEKRRRSEEIDIEAEGARLKDREAKLYAIKTNKEYQAAIKEIADAKQAVKDREEALLRLMEKIDILDEEITQLISGIADKENAFREKEAELKKAEAGLVAERDKLSAQSKEASMGVDPKTLKAYRTIQTRHSDAMAIASSGVCSGCNKRIPPQLYIELQKWNDLITCPNCHRLLFCEQQEEGSEK